MKPSRSAYLAAATATAIMIALALTVSPRFVMNESRGESPNADADNAKRFEQAKAILSRCAACHNEDDASGGLDLSTRDAAMEGGSSGAAIQPGDAKASRVHRMVAAGKMPPKTKLTPQETETIRDWIDHGAFWPAVDPLRPSPADDPRWAFRPLSAAPAPAVRDSAWVRDPIDAFILAKLEQAGLKPAPAASRRTLIRRASFDLIGLPPTPEAIAEFQDDPRSDRDAFAALIDRLLASPRYGERWGRHWLDLARFGESQGFERDKIRDHAWRYRDYVIQAFNADKPYGDFIKEQIAGDLLEPSRSDAVIASSFLVCGPWDEVGAAQVSALMRARVREEELEEMIGVVSQTFLGLTVNCARCHDHKFDPIPQRDYYRIQAGLAEVRPGDRSILPPDDEKRRLARLDAIRKRADLLRSRTLTLEAAGRDRVRRDQSGSGSNSPAISKPISAVKPWLRWDFETGVQDREQKLSAKLVGQARLDGGQLHVSGERAFLESAPLPADLAEKTLEAWVALANLDQRGGGILSVQAEDGSIFDAIVYGEEQPRKWMAGSEGFRRTQARDAALETASPQHWVHMAIVYRDNGRIELYRDGAPYGEGYPSTGPRKFARGKSRVLIGLRHFGGRGAQFHGSIEEARIYDRALSAKEIAESYQAGCGQVPRAQALAALSDQEKAEIRTIEAESAKLHGELAAGTPMVYGVTPKPAPAVKILERGDPEKGGETVAPGGLSAIRSVSDEFGLSPKATDRDARLKLAEYLADPANPLTARVLANRVWLHHFGAGLIGSPNDFGANGERPSHPELLDHLATAFLEGGRRLKPLHKRIMLSASYLQSSRWDEQAAKADAEARLLWRYPPQRLEGEAIRDAMLAASGELNLQTGGPGFRPFQITIFNAHLYAPTDPVGPEFNRRTIYRTQVNSGRSPFLDLLDCPDPSVKTPKRAVTTTPLQALALMNDSFVLRQAKRLADRVRRETVDDPAKHLDRAFLLTLGRSPEPKELDRLRPLAQEHGLETACWVLFNSNEFLQRP